MSRLNLFIISIASLTLVGCDHMNIAELNERIILETGYRSQLAKKYKEMVNYEADEMMDYFDAAHFAAKAIKALDDDDPPGPEKLKNWHIKNPFKEDLTKAFKRLNVALNMGIRDSIPEATAEAVVGFDCWVEQTEEGWQLSHIRLCRDRFKNAMKQIEDKVGLTITDEATAERKIVIYYDHDSSTISPEDRAYLSAELMRIPMHEKISLVVTGHADRKGSERYNQNLSMERAIGIHRVLANFGIREQSIGISAEGETAPAILTKDGASEPQNRRSEILIKLQL